MHTGHKKSSAPYLEATKIENSTARVIGEMISAPGAAEVTPDIAGHCASSGKWYSFYEIQNVSLHLPFLGTQMWNNEKIKKNERRKSSE